MNLGDLIVRIGGDPAAFSELQSNLTEGKAALTEFGGAVEALAGSGDVFKQLAEESGQLTLFGSAATETADQLELFDAQSIEAADSLEQVGDAAQSAAPRLTDAGDAARKAGQESQDASASVFELLKGLTELAEISIAGITLERFADFAAEASDMLTRADISLTALTGSATLAKQEIGELEELAGSDALAFPQLLAAATKMQALLGPGTELAENFRHIADGAAVAGTSVEAAASAFDRLVAIGNASGRTLVPLGVSLDALAKAENEVSGKADQVATSAAAAFKALDQAQRVEVLNTALANFNGIAEKIASNTYSGAFQKIGNDVEKMAGQVAESTKSASLSVLNFIDTILKIGNELRAWGDGTVSAVSATQDLSQAFQFYDKNAVVPTVQSMLNLGEASQQVITKHRDLVDQVTSTRAAYEHLANALRDNAGLAHDAGITAGTVAQAHQQWKAAVDALNNSMGKQKDTLAQIIEAQTTANQTYANAIAAGAQLHGTFDTLTGVYVGTTNQLNLLARAQGDAQKAWEAANPAVLAQIKAFEDLAGLSSTLGGRITSIAQAMDLIPRAAQPSIEKLDDLNNVLEQVLVIKGDKATHVMIGLEGALHTVGDGLTEVKTAAGDGTVEITKFSDSALVATDSSNQLGNSAQLAADNLKSVMESVRDAAETMGNSVGPTQALANATQALADSAANAAANEGSLNAAVGKGGRGRKGGEGTDKESSAQYLQTLLAITSDPFGMGFDPLAAEQIAAALASMGDTVTTQGLTFGPPPTTTITGAKPSAKAGAAGSPAGGGAGASSSVIDQFNKAATAVADAAATVQDLQTAMAGVTTGDASFAGLQSQLAAANAQLDKASQKYETLLAQLTGVGASLTTLSTTASAGASAIATSSTSLVAAGAAFQSATLGVPAAFQSILASLVLPPLAQLSNPASFALTPAVPILAPAAAGPGPAAGFAMLPASLSTGSLFGRGFAGGTPAAYNLPPSTTNAPLVVQTNVTGNTIATAQQAQDLASALADQVMQKVVTVLRLAGLR